MDLNLEDRFTKEELNEIRKRVFSFADQMFMEGISVGRELSREEIYDTTEQFVKDKLSAMTVYFVQDKMWSSMPPQGYNPDPNVDIASPVDDIDYGAAVDRAAQGPEHMMMNPENDRHPGDFEPQEPPEWVKENRQPRPNE